jgi:hypothetical protein
MSDRLRYSVDVHIVMRNRVESFGKCILHLCSVINTT